MQNWHGVSFRHDQVCAVALHLHVSLRMHIVYQADGSRMQGLIGPNAAFFLFLGPGDAEPVLTLSGDEVTRIIHAHVAQSHLVMELTKKLSSLDPRRDLYPRRRLLGQHKALRGR